jgi:hypothetical protein
MHGAVDQQAPGGHAAEQMPPARQTPHADDGLTRHAAAGQHRPVAGDHG